MLKMNMIKIKNIKYLKFYNGLQVINIYINEILKTKNCKNG